MGFEKTPLTDREQRLRDGMATRLGLTTTPGRASNLAALSAEVAAEVDDAHTHILYQAQQIHSTTAAEENLIIKARNYGLIRKPAQSATGQITFTGTDGATVAAATIIRHGDGREYLTDSEINILNGVGAVNVTASMPGIVGNLALNENLSLINPIAGIQSTATTTAIITGGTDLEEIEAFRTRVLFRQSFPPQAGHGSDYVVWATDVPGVIAAWHSDKEMGLGTVTVRFSSDDAFGGPIPTEALRQAVEDHIESHINPITNQLTGRPGGIDVFVVAPTAKIIDLVFEVLTPADATTLANIATGVNEMLRAKATPGATIYKDWIDEAISQAVGENNHKLTSPADNVVCTINELAIFGTITPPV